MDKMWRLLMKPVWPNTIHFNKILYTTGTKISGCADYYSVSEIHTVYFYRLNTKSCHKNLSFYDNVLYMHVGLWIPHCDIVYAFIHLTSHMWQNMSSWVFHVALWQNMSSWVLCTGTLVLEDIQAPYFQWKETAIQFHAYRKTFYIIVCLQSCDNRFVTHVWVWWIGVHILQHMFFSGPQPSLWAPPSCRFSLN